jgi:hypothetical protein
MIPKFRASYSVINTWASGDWQRAIQMYYKIGQFTTRAMAEGRDYHEKWCKEITETKHLPAAFGGGALFTPVCEKKLVVELADWLDLVFIIDCYDKPDIHEFKTGKTSSESYASSYQSGIYAVGATYAGLLVDRAILHHFDQTNGKYDMSIKWITDQVLKDTMEFITTISSEMQDYIIKNDLNTRFGGNLERFKAKVGEPSA